MINNYFKSLIISQPFIIKMLEYVQSSMRFIASYLKEIDDNFFKKSKKVTAKDMFYHNMLSTLDGVGVHSANITFAIKTDNCASAQALEKASNKVPSDIFRKFADLLIPKFFLTPNRILAVDGSVISINKLIKSGNPFDETNTGSFRKGYLTVVYDVIARVPIAARIDHICRERAALMDLSNY